MCPPNHTYILNIDPRVRQLLREVAHRRGGFGVGASPQGRVIFINYAIAENLAYRDGYFRSGQPRWRLTECGKRVARYLRERHQLANTELLDASYDQGRCPLLPDPDDELYTGYHDYEDWERNPDTDWEAEERLINRLYMRPDYRGPLSLNEIQGLTRAFHINTIVARILSEWVSPLVARPKWVARHYPEAALAYLLFKDAVLLAVACLPEKQGLDVNTGQYMNVLSPLYATFPSLEYTDCYDIVQSMRSAYRINKAIWGHQPSQARNFQNFFEIVVDEFYTLSDRARTLAEDVPTPVTQAIRNELSDEVKYYYNDFWPS